MMINATRDELCKLKQFCKLQSPFVIEFGGTPRSGKTSAIASIAKFLKKANFNVSCIEEISNSDYPKNENKNLTNLTSSSDSYNLTLFQTMYDMLTSAISTNDDFILLDRSITDRQIWHATFNKKTNESYFESLRKDFPSFSKELIDLFIVTYASPINCLKREYKQTLYLERRNVINLDILERYNESLKELKDYLMNYVDNSFYLNTDNQSLSENNVAITNAILDTARKKYLDSFNKQYSFKL